MSPNQERIAEKFIQTAKESDSVIDSYDFRDANKLEHINVVALVKSLIELGIVESLSQNDRMIRLTEKGWNYNAYNTEVSNFNRTDTNQPYQKIKLTELPASLWFLVILISAIVCVLVLYIMWSILVSTPMV